MRAFTARWPAPPGHSSTLSAVLEVLDGMSDFRKGEPKQQSAIVGIQPQRIRDSPYEGRRKPPALRRRKVRRREASLSTEAWPK